MARDKNKEDKVPNPVDEFIEFEDNNLEFNISRSYDNLRNIVAFISGDADENEDTSRSISRVDNNFKKEMHTHRMGYARYKTVRQLELLGLINDCERKLKKKGLNNLNEDQLMKLRSDSQRELSEVTKHLDNMVAAPTININLDRGQSAEIVTEQEKIERASRDTLRELFEFFDVELVRRGRQRLTASEDD